MKKPWLVTGANVEEVFIRDIAAVLAAAVLVTLLLRSLKRQRHLKRSASKWAWLLYILANVLVLQILRLFGH